MSNLAVFQFDGQEVRFVGTPDKPEWVAQDVCNILGIQNASDSIKRLDDYQKGVANVYTLGGSQKMVTVTEAGLYALIFTSRKPTAKDFQRWVFEEVLPAIRKTGQYGTNQFKDIVWHNRLVLYKKKTVIPVGYFSIFAETTCGLIADFETIGYVLPESATIDISIGKHWSNYAKTQVKNIDDYRTYYSHFYPDARGEVQAYMYKVELLPMFRIWAETDYKLNHLAGYLKRKDRQALYVLADLMGEPLLPGIVDDLTKKKLAG